MMHLDNVFLDNLILKISKKINLKETCSKKKIYDVLIFLRNKFPRNIHMFSFTIIYK